LKLLKSNGNASMQMHKKRQPKTLINPFYILNQRLMLKIIEPF